MSEMPQTNPEDSRVFLEHILGRGLPAPHKAIVFTLPSTATEQCPTVDSALKHVKEVGARENTYLGVYTVDHLLGTGRGGAEDVSGLLGLGGDIDYGQKANKKPYPPTAEDAAAIARLHLRPTLLIDSGGGLQAWWLFETPLLFSDAPDIRLPERESAGNLSRKWNLLLRRDANAKGWTFDSTGDIARVLRIAGTMNVNYAPPRLVRLLSTDGPRYALADFRKVIAEAGDLPEHEAPESVDFAHVKITLRTDATPPPQALARLLENPEFAKVWAGIPHEGWSPSEYDQSIALRAARADWTDQEIADLLVAGRRVRQVDLKLQNVDKYRRTIAKARKWAAEMAGNGGGATVGVLLSEVTPERVSWLWPGRIPYGKLTVLDGDPGKGKSTLSLDLAARVSRGRPLPGEPAGVSPAGVVILSGEDGLADTIAPRLIAAGADCTRVVALQSCPDQSGDGEHPPVLPDDLASIREAIARVGAELVIIDPLMAYLSGDTNSHKDQDIRRVLFRLATLAEETGAAVLVVRHLNKTAGGPALYRGGGSIGIIGAARSGLLVAADPENEDGRVLASTKSNLSRPPESLSFHLDAGNDGAARVVWDGTSQHGANALLALPASDDDRHAIDEAKDFLLAALADGFVAAKDVQAEARAAGISDATLRRAKGALGVKSEKLDMQRGWVWTLRRCSQRAEGVHPVGTNTFTEVEHLRETPSPSEEDEPSCLFPLPSSSQKVRI